MTGQQSNMPESRPDLANLSTQEIASNQQARVVPWFAGTRKMAVSWISPVYNIFTKKFAPSPVPGSIFTSPESFLDPSGLAEMLGVGATLLNKQNQSQARTAFYGSAGALVSLEASEILSGIVNA